MPLPKGKDFKLGHYLSFWLFQGLLRFAYRILLGLGA
jgi:hypothetical protein